MNLEYDPELNTFNSSTYTGTPQLTINHGGSIDQDSSNAFEGPEKLLEVWFATSPDSLPSCAATEGLKVVPAGTWEDMLDLVHCKVLSTVRSPQVDAYLLSESSMFVFPHKLILKTCGTTTLLQGLPCILEIAARVAKFPHTTSNSTIGTAAYPYRVFYSRKNFLFPDRQHGPHRSWMDEVKSLDSLFEKGSAYVIGKLNGEHWYLYLTEPNTRLTPPYQSCQVPTLTTRMEPPSYRASVAGFNAGRGSGFGEDDETLEILMTDLDEVNARQFYLDQAKDRALGSVASIGKSGRNCDEESRTDPINHAINKKTTQHDVLDINLSSSNGIMCSSPEDLAVKATDDVTEGHALGTLVSATCGLADIYPSDKYPEARVDAYLFSPCGFSANAVIPAPDGPQTTHYFTVHVTPEPSCSYASFETNVPCKQSGRQTNDIIQQVVHIFKPGRFSVTFFETKQAGAREKNMHLGGNGGRAEIRNGSADHVKDSRGDTISGYRRIDRIVHDFDEYDLVFKYFERLESVVDSNALQIDTEVPAT